MTAAMRHAIRLIVSIMGLVFLGGLAAAANAQSVAANALIDLGMVIPSDQKSFNKGGLGNFEFGGGGNQTPLPIGQALADLRARLAPPLEAFATLRFAPDQHA